MVFNVRHVNILSGINEVASWLQPTHHTYHKQGIKSTFILTYLNLHNSQNKYHIQFSGCGYNSPADLVFAVPPEAAIADTKQSMRFIRDVMMEFDIASDKVRMGLVPKECTSHPGFNLMSSTSKEKILKMFDLPLMPQSDTATIIKYMRTNR